MMCTSRPSFLLIKILQHQAYIKEIFYLCDNMLFYVTIDIDVMVVSRTQSGLVKCVFKHSFLLYPWLIAIVFVDYLKELSLLFHDIHVFIYTIKTPE